MTFRPWTYEDVYAVAALEKQCFSDPWTFRMLADSFFSENTRTLAAEEGGELAGYAILSVLFEDAELADIAVSPKFRRRGLADEMLARLEGEARAAGAGRVLLEVRVSNAPAMRLYLKRGYVGCGVRPRYYADGEDALIMQKRLAGANS